MAASDSIKERRAQAWPTFDYVITTDIQINILVSEIRQICTWS